MSWERVIAVVVSVTACLATPPPPNKPPNVTGCAAFAHAVCTKREACTNGFANQRDFGSESACEVRSAISCVDASQILNTGQTAAQIQECVTEYPSYSCVDF